MMKRFSLTSAKPLLGEGKLQGYLPLPDGCLSNSSSALLQYSEHGCQNMFDRAGPVQQKFSFVLLPRGRDCIR
jgi:hypothetical protein